MQNKMKKTNPLTVINVATKTIKKQKPLDINSAIKVARKSLNQSIGGFLPIVPILTALSALGSLANGSAAIAKTN